MARHTPLPTAAPPRQPRTLLPTFRLLALLAVAALLAPLSAGVLLAAPANLQVAVTDTLVTTTPGEQLTYTLRVSNTGADPLADVRARIQLSPSVTFVSASDSPATLGGGVYEWAIPSLLGNSVAFRYLTVNVKSPLAPGTVITTNAEADQLSDTTPNTASDTTTVEAPQVTLDPASLAFAAQQVGTTSAAQSVTLTNSGNQPLTISSIAVSGDFTFTSTCGASLAVDASCTIDVTFAPTMAGARVGTLSVNNSASGSPHTVALSGTGTQPAVALDTASLNFGNQRVGTTSASRQVKLTNSGSAPLVIGSIAAGGDFAQTNPCPATLAVGASCTIDVTFTPAALGLRTGTLSIVSDAPGSPHTVTLEGIGTQPGVTLDKTSLSFGNQPLNTASASQQVKLTNSGGASLTITGITAGGDFAQTNTCGTTLAAGASCTIDVTFTPTALGLRTGTLTIASDAPGGPHTVALEGTGLSAAVEITPASIDFGGLAVGATSAAQSVTIVNTGNDTLTLTSISISGDFAQTNACPPTLAPSASCTVSVTFTPTAMGARSGTLTFANSAPGGSQTVALTGVGLQSALSLSPASLDFGSQRVGTTSAVRQVTLTNTGNQALSISGLAIAPAGEFAQTNACPPTLAANAGCTVDITFTPSATGPRTATLTINSDAPNNPHTLALSGAGTDPQASLSPKSLDFGDQQVNTSATQDVTLTNTGVGALTISGISISGDYAQTNNCPASLAQGASCTISVTFNPAAQQPRPGTLSVASDATGSPHSVSLAGVGIQPVVSLNPTSLDFGSLAVNSTSAPQAITLTNTGSQPLVLSSIATSSGFAQTNTCPVAPAPIAIGASCTISISFTPASVGPVSGALTIGSNAPSSPHTLTLAGVGSGAVYASTPAPGTITMSSLIGSSNSVSITVSNEGNQALNVSGPAESVAAPFSLAPSGAYTIAAGGAAQVLAVSCAPTGVGPFSQQLTYTTNDPARPTAAYTVVCTGTTAATPAYSSNPAPGSALALGAAPVGGSVSADIAISESGTAALIVGLNGGSAASAISGANAGDFTIVAPTSFPITIGDGAAAQQLTVRCQPSAAGTRSATLTLTTNDPGQPSVSYALSCVGQAATSAQRFAFLPLVAQVAAAPAAKAPDLVAAVSVSPSSVAAGQPVVVSVTVTNQGEAEAGEFWVDLYINPSAAPTGPNQPWNGRCSLSPCYGIAWYVSQALAPGQSVTLTSEAQSYYAKNTIWDGSFAPGTSDLYVYVDSWNPTVAEGAVAESNEGNNRGELHGLSVAGSASPSRATRDAAALPLRPARPAR